MQLSVTGHHVEITAAMRSYVEKKLDRIVRHFDFVIDTHFVLTVEKLLHKAEATLRVRGETIHALASEGDMYAAIDALADKLERRVRKHKEKLTDHHALEAQKSPRL
ncbi:MAG TPA: ribosome-associated translation inhibitor RaiA [Steroidobacteraceae bacterium]|jgi:putative sigma-54 modulation protein|nr:ribosome-associated translation inhibitor RaiA [Steroidobacteraceae bacterium]